MFRITQPKANAVVATYQFVKAIGAKVTEETVEETLKSHPDFPSLLATSDALGEWGIENVAVKITTEQLQEISTPFLAYLQSEGGIFVLVKSLKNDKVEWLHTAKGIQKESLDEFHKKWNGVVLMAEANENSVEKDYGTNRQKEIIKNLRTPVLLIGFTTLIISLLYKNFLVDWRFNVLLTTKLLGTVISSLLLWQSIDKNNPFIKTLCQAPTKSGKDGEGCNSILNSKAAQVTSWLSWSEVGFFYFAGGFLNLTLNPSPSGEGLIIFQILAILSLPYTFWSIYHQAFVAKQWCTLCLAIQAVLIIEFGLSIYSLINSANWTTINLSHAMIPLQGLGVATLFWIFLKPILQKSQQVEPLKNDLRRFKNNPNLFLSLLQKQEEMPFVPAYLKPVMIGNPKAEHTITMVTNPLCQPCANAHKTIEKILESNENLNCQVIFLASAKPKDTGGKIARIIFSLPQEQQAEILTEWFKNEERSVEKWQRQLGVVSSGMPASEESIKLIKHHAQWCELAKIAATPTIYIDGFKKPDLYRLEDLKGVLKYLPTMDFAKS
ncbi:MAG: cysteine peptidase family C39 domain-containing protein [Arcicella sp.]|jgi:uncharacterized membrane protein|nr:cysteine peptidase family C39 domain-containing protein [Arcicella sp.]